MVWHFALTFAAGLLATVAATSSSLPTQYFFTFGDSYTTTGFDPNGTQPSLSNPLGNPAYPGQTSDNGENWIDVLVYNTSHTQQDRIFYNEAVGGTVIDNSVISPDATDPIAMLDLVGQVGRVEAINRTAVPWTGNNTIITSWFGVNDVDSVILNTLFGKFDINEAYSRLDRDAASYFVQLDKLYQLGARKFITMFMPPLWRTPYWQGNGNQTVIDQVQNGSMLLNSNLQSGISQFQSNHSGVQMITLDSISIFAEFLDNPQKYGAPNNTCTTDQNPACLWANSIHPAVTIQTEVGMQMALLINNLTGSS